MQHHIIMESIVCWDDVAVIDGGQCEIESGHEGIRCGLVATVRYQELHHTISNSSGAVRRNGLSYNEVEVAAVGLLVHVILRGRGARLTARAAKY